MKKIIIIFLTALVWLNAQGQFESRYEFGNAPPILKECDALGEAKGSNFAPPAGSIFKITSLKNSEIAIATCLFFGTKKDNDLDLNNAGKIAKYLKFNCRSAISLPSSASQKEKDEERELEELKVELSAKEKNSTVISLKEAEEYRLYFLIPVAYLTTHAVPVYRTGIYNTTFVVGAQTKLFKIRSKQFDFAKDVSFGTTFGFKIRTNPRRDNFLNIVTGVGVALNNIDSVSAVKYATSGYGKDVGAFSVGLGFVKEYGKAQISIMFGKDFLSKSNNYKYDWIYNKKTWISFGVGVSIFTSEDTKKQSTQDDKNK